MKKNIKIEKEDNVKKKVKKIDDDEMYLIDLQNLLNEKPYTISNIIFDKKTKKYFFIFVDKKGDISYIYKVSKVDFKKHFVEKVVFISDIFNRIFSKKNIENIVEEIFNNDDELKVDSVKFRGDKLLAFKKKMNNRNKGRRCSTKLILSLTVPKCFIKNEDIDFTSLMIYIIDYYRNKYKHG